MIRGLRTGIKYFTLGLLAGLVFAPRKGSETFKLLVGRGKEYAEENLNITERARRDSEA
jgi:hypothetical protein